MPLHPILALDHILDEYRASCGQPAAGAGVGSGTGGGVVTRLSLSCCKSKERGAFLPALSFALIRGLSTDVSPRSALQA